MCSADSFLRRSGFEASNMRYADGNAKSPGAAEFTKNRHAVRIGCQSFL